MLLKSNNYQNNLYNIHPKPFSTQTNKLKRYSFLNKYSAHKAGKKESTNAFSKYKTTYNFGNYSIQKLRTTSNASRSTFLLKTLIPLHFLKIKKFFLSTTSSRRGRSKEGILCRTKGRVLLKHRYPLINLKFRTLSLSLIGGYYVTPLKLKTLSFIVSASGEACYIPTTSIHGLFHVSKFISTFTKDKYLRQYSYLSTFIKIPQICHLIWQLPKFKPISFLEIYPGKGSQYVKCAGSKSFITKTNTKTSLALVKLPSGVHKTFSTYSVGALGRIPLVDKVLKSQSNAGFFKKLGKKSLSRGVAKNPVDHPHGGRNKAIRYQRTP